MKKDKFYYTFVGETTPPEFHVCKQGRDEPLVRFPDLRSAKRLAEVLNKNLDTPSQQLLHTTSALGISVGSHPKFWEMIDHVAEKGQCMLDVELAVRDLAVNIEERYGDEWRAETRDFIVDIDEFSASFIAETMGLPPWTEHPRFPVSDWRHEVTEDNTRLGYREWVMGILDEERS
jgi:hypothetical protein